MRLTVNHRTTYHFAPAMRRVVQSHRLTPSRCAGQTVIDWQIEVPGAVRGAAFGDGAGDWIETISLLGPVETLEVHVTGLVATEDLSGVLRGHKEVVHPLVYLRETRATRSEVSISELARAAVEPLGAGAQPLDRGHALMGAVADAVAYRPGTTEAHTTAAEALALGEGVCQDHAHLIIAAARHLGIPARYVSGYLSASEDEDPYEASHAWAELWVGDLGWVGFDPSNKCCPDERYIRLASGLDAVDGAPIRGVAEGAGEEQLEVAVAVGAAQQ